MIVAALFATLAFTTAVIAVGILIAAVGAFVLRLLELDDPGVLLSDPAARRGLLHYQQH